MITAPNLITAPNWALVQNARAQAFWRVEAERLRDRIKIPAFREVALRQLNRAASLATQPSLEQALADVERDAFTLAPYVRSLNGRRAATERKPDALQDLIVSLVQRRPKMSCSDLLQTLDSGDHRDVIDEVVEGEIHFRHKVGRRHEVSKSVKISALKDRLSRAKKAVRPKR